MPVEDAVLWPVLGHVGLIFFLYAWLTVARTRAVKRGETEYGCFILGRDEPLHVARITRNLSNQFELPLLFYFLIALLLLRAELTSYDVMAAWVFLIGRLVHTYVQTQTDNVKLRGQVFLINFLGVAYVAAHVGWNLLQA